MRVFKSFFKWLLTPPAGIIMAGRTCIRYEVLMPKVTELPLSENYKPEQALEAAKMAQLDDVIVIGRSKGVFFLTSSEMDTGTALYLLKHAEYHAIGLIHGEHKC